MGLYKVIMSINKIESVSKFPYGNCQLDPLWGVMLKLNLAIAKEVATGKGKILPYQGYESISLLSSSSLNNLDHHDDDGNDQQNMNESTTHMTNKSQQPQNEENHTYGPKHVRLLSDDRMCLSISIYFGDP